MSIAYLGIGSNMGDRAKNICDALKFLETYDIEILKRSTLIETEPVGGPPQGKFLNGAVKIQTFLNPEDLLKCLKSIEVQLGRIKTIVNGPRPIDLDILLYDDLTVKTPDLTIPHPRMFEREFVLCPLREINENI